MFDFFRINEILDYTIMTNLKLEYFVSLTKTECTTSRLSHYCMMLHQWSHLLSFIVIVEIFNFLLCGALKPQIRFAVSSFKLPKFQKGVQWNNVAFHLNAMDNPDDKINSQIARLNAVAAKLRAEAAELEVRYFLNFGGFQMPYSEFKTAIFCFLLHLVGGTKEDHGRQSCCCF